MSAGRDWFNGLQVSNAILEQEIARATSEGHSAAGPSDQEAGRPERDFPTASEPQPVPGKGNLEEGKIKSVISSEGPSDSTNRVAVRRSDKKRLRIQPSNKRDGKKECFQTEAKFNLAEMDVQKKLIDSDMQAFRALFADLRSDGTDPVLSAGFRETVLEPKLEKWRIQ
jgi:hypothetical protein